MIKCPICSNNLTQKEGLRKLSAQIGSSEIVNTQQEIVTGTEVATLRDGNRTAIADTPKDEKEDGNKEKSKELKLKIKEILKCQRCNVCMLHSNELKEMME